MKKFSVNLLKVGILFILGLCFYSTMSCAASYLAPPIYVEVKEGEVARLNQTYFRSKVLPEILPKDTKIEEISNITTKFAEKKYKNTWDDKNVNVDTFNEEILIQGLKKTGDNYFVIVYFDFELTPKEYNEKVEFEDKKIMIMIKVIPSPSISISPTSLDIDVNESKTLTATTQNVNGEKVIWTSGNKGVATVNNNGTVTGVKSGNATIKASITVDGKSYQATCNVTVNDQTTKSGEKNTTTTTTNTTSKNIYTVNFNANGGTGSMSAQEITHGTSTSLRKNTFTKTGYTFKGWYAQRSKDGYWYFGNDQWKAGSLSSSGLYLYKDGQKVSKTVAPGASVTMYAVWEKVEDSKDIPIVNSNNNIPANDIDQPNIVLMIVDIIMKAFDYLIQKVFPFIKNTILPTVGSAVETLVTSISSQ